MEAYIRNELSVSSDTTLDQATMHSAKLLIWLLDCQDEMQMQQQQLELNHTDIECMFKATLYLHECYARYGDELVEAVLLHFTYAQAAVRQFYESCERNREQCIKQLCGYIINGTRNGHTYAPLLYQMHKAYADVQPSWSVIKELNWSAFVENKNNETLDVATATELNIDVLQMRTLVRRIFRLATVEDMRIALQRSMHHIGYELWLQLFREPKESILYMRCYLLRQMICDMLAEGISGSSDSMVASATARFVHNIYRFVANGKSNNLSRLFRSLMHLRFANALGSYLHVYWTQHLLHLQLDDIKLADEAPIVTVGLSLDEMLFLTHLLLMPKSPCRTQFIGELRTLPLFNRLLELLNKVAYVYS
ncbi:uncharacterized protein LOC117793704 [Drosophila innubila]|uniref:uncharacterized protein LOC117793704 n=1 Tax=Drosophila innubila TaxID=198719 RepID=UPI00148D3065|nr:uncharacterized protein LOC117793704 [Drosophila innubila]